MTTTTKPEFRAPSQMPPATPMSPVSPSPLVGTWKSKSNNVVEAVITASGAALKVHLFGACVPTSCDWGAVSTTPYSATVAGGPAVAFSANYSFGFSTVLVVGHLQGSQLILETMTHFTDGSGRANFYFSETMAK
jgi:hypothetical protein